MITDAELAQRLARPAGADQGDWPDVKRRQRRRRRRGGRLVVVAAAVGLGAPLAVALGARQQVVAGLLGADAPPARPASVAIPKKAAKAFSLIVKPPADYKATPLPWPMNGAKIVAGSERRVARIRLSNGDPESLYVADMQGGGWCSVTIGTASSAGSCQNRPLPGFIASSSGQARRGSPIVIAGRIDTPNATALRVSYDDETTSLAPLAENWFLFEVTPAHQKTGHRVTAFQAVNAQGAVLLTQDTPLGAPRPAPLVADPTTIRRRDAQILPNNGGRVALSTARAANGQRCIRVLRNGHRQQSPAWYCGSYVAHGFAGHPVFLQTRVNSGSATGRGYVYLYGSVASAIHTLRLRFQNHTTTTIRLHDRAFLYVVPTSAFAKGRRPASLVATDLHGHHLETIALHPNRRCYYPSHDAACTHITTADG